MEENNIITAMYRGFLAFIAIIINTTLVLSADPFINALYTGFLIVMAKIVKDITTSYLKEKDAL